MRGVFIIRDDLCAVHVFENEEGGKPCFGFVGTKQRSLATNFVTEDAANEFIADNRKEFPSTKGCKVVRFNGHCSNCLDELPNDHVDPNGTPKGPTCDICVYEENTGRVHPSRRKRTPAK